MFTVVIPVLNQHDTTEELVGSWFRLAKSRVKVVFIDNGSDVPLSEKRFYQKWADHHHVTCIRNEENLGVYPTFQQGLEGVESPFIFYSHNDVEMLEWGWDSKLKRLLTVLSYSHRPQYPGVCGMFGAKGIGTPEIYQAPYDFRQLMRWDCVTVPGMEDPGAARQIQAEWEPVMVLDGFSLIVSRKMIREAMGGRFDHARFPVHHMYDQDICVSSHYGGFCNYVLDIDCKHHGGVTSTREKWAEKLGSSDLKIHREAHKVFYDKWRGKLPVGVK